MSRVRREVLYETRIAIGPSMIQALGHLLELVEPFMHFEAWRLRAIHLA